MTDDEVGYYSNKAPRDEKKGKSYDETHTKEPKGINLICALFLLFSLLGQLFFFFYFKLDPIKVAKNIYTQNFKKSRQKGKKG